MQWATANQACAILSAHINLTIACVSKVKLMTSFLRSPKYKDKYDEVPDPYFGGEKGFELVRLYLIFSLSFPKFQCLFHCA